MGIKTSGSCAILFIFLSLKNLPTTWGLRLQAESNGLCFIGSEKPPHHMGIKT